MITTENNVTNLQEELQNSPEDLIIILGPTASGKTKLAVSLAQVLNAEIISADSRQVYTGMDIGTGKDLSEYGLTPYHLIDIIEPGERYHVAQFLMDFEEVYQNIKSRNKKVIVCGGTGFYIQSLLEARAFTQVPVNLGIREQFASLKKEELRQLLLSSDQQSSWQVDLSSHKRMIRALEILHWLKNHPEENLTRTKQYSAKVIGLNPEVSYRRERSSKRLKERLDQGMILEVEHLLKKGLSYDEIEYYGLEYKYISYYLRGVLDYDSFYKKLETEIHRYAKRQMTYFRKMEKDGIAIKWI